MAAEWVPLTDLSVVNTRQVRDCALQRIATISQFGAFVDGDEVTQFEEKWADYVGARYCVAVGNGTDALELAVRGMYGALTNLPGLAIPAMTFVATAEAVVRAGEEVHLLDVDPVTLLAHRANVAVGLYGQQVLDDGWAGVVDAAQMHGHRLPGRTASWSFYPTKNLGAWGDAGAVTTDDEGLADGIRELARHGYGGATGVGFNSRMDSVQAAVLIEKLPHLNEWVSSRATAAARYFTRLAGTVPIVGTDAVPSVWHQFVVRVPNRDAVLRLMQAKRIHCGVHYARALSTLPWLIPFRPDYAGDAADLCPEAERAAGDVLSLPLWPGMPLATIERVVDALLRSIDEAKQEAERD